VTPAPWPWLEVYASRHGFRYRADADERWIRVWEPYVTLRTPVRYEHALEATGEVGSLTIARLVAESGTSAWIALVQDPRLASIAAATSDGAGLFGEPLQLVTMPRRATGDADFDRVFASFAPTEGDLARAVTPSVRKLVLGWRIPVHFEVRRGGFLLAPTSIGADPAGLAWLAQAAQVFGVKATKPLS
jgi:hypothetical protein